MKSNKCVPGTKPGMGGHSSEPGKMPASKSGMAQRGSNHVTPSTTPGSGAHTRSKPGKMPSGRGY